MNELETYAMVQVASYAGLYDHYLVHSEDYESFQDYLVKNPDALRELSHMVQDSAQLYEKRKAFELPPHLHVQYLCEYCQETANDPDMHRYCTEDEV